MSNQLPSKQRVVIKYQVATYSGTEIVFCDKDDDNDIVIAKCKEQLRRKYGPLPYGVTSFTIVTRRNVKD